MRLARLQEVLTKLGPAWMLLAFWLVCPAVTGPTLVAKLGRVVDWLGPQPLHGLPLWTAGLAVVIGLGLLPAYANTIVCGWVFGFGLGLLSAMTTYLLSACLSHLIVKKVSVRHVAALIQASESAQRVQLALLRCNRRRALLIVTLFRLTGFPYPAGTLVLTSCGVSLRQNLLGTICGMMPRIAVATLIISRFAATGAHDIQAFLRASNNLLMLALGLLFGLAVLAVIAQIARNALNQLATGPQRLRVVGLPVK